jgi:hypothetical protein
MQVIFFTFRASQESLNPLTGIVVLVRAMSPSDRQGDENELYCQQGRVVKVECPTDAESSPSKLTGVRPEDMIVATSAGREHAKETCERSRTHCSSLN